MTREDARDAVLVALSNAAANSLLLQAASGPQLNIPGEIVVEWKEQARVLLKAQTALIAKMPCSKEAAG